MADNPAPKIIKKKNKLFSFLVSFFSVLLILISLIVTTGFFLIYAPGKQLYDRLLSAKTEVTNLKAAISDKNLTSAAESLKKLQSHLSKISQSYSRFSWTSSLPYLKNYYQDGQAIMKIAQDGLETGDIVIKAVGPYQDFLGLKGGTSTDNSKTTSDRLNFLTESVESLVPYLATIESKVASISTSLDQIDPNRYPEEFHGFKIKSSLVKAKESISEAHKLIKDGQPILTKMSWLLGKDKPRNYFLIFQNDAELRPTGGFWTAYGTLKVDKGRITPGISSDIYSLDAKFNSTIPAPRPIKAYHINVPYFNLRDMNISADFPESISTFLKYYQRISGSKEKIDAVIALDTQVLVDLVKILGRIGVSDYGNFSADPDKRCDGCPQIIYQLEWIAGRPRNYIETNRKGFLGPLMNNILANALGAEKSKIGPLVEAGLNNIHQKHILFYFTDPEVQSAAVAANISGSIIATNSDYFHLNDANMSSAKTNLFLKQKIKHEIISQNGKIEHKVTITYINPSRASNCNLEKGDLCLNAAQYRDWFRFYVPIGSKLVKMTGSEVDPVVYEENGKQVFEGFYGNKYPLYAMSNVKTSIQYESSATPGSNYSLYLQKQPGTKPIEYEIFFNGQKLDSFSWVADKIIKLPF